MSATPSLATMKASTMEEDYYGAHNKYDYLPDDAARQAVDDGVGVVAKKFKLHVTNIPPDLNLHGLKNIFQKFGKVSETYVHHPVGAPATAKKWGHVQFMSHLSAQNAIDQLDKAPPMHFNVRYALSQGELEARREAQTQAMTSAEDHIQQMDAFHRGFWQPNPSGRTQVENLGRGSLIAKRERELADHRVPLHLTAGLRPNSMKTYDDSYSSAVDEDQPRSAGGRAPALNPVTEVDLSLYSAKQFGNPVILSKVPPKTCEHCGNPGRVRCSRCRSWYCGQRCQVEDWPSHKSGCITPPALVYPDGTFVVNRPRHPPNPAPPAPLHRTQDDPNHVPKVKEASEDLPLEPKVIAPVDAKPMPLSSMAEEIQAANPVPKERDENSVKTEVKAVPIVSTPSPTPFKSQGKETMATEKVQTKSNRNVQFAESAPQMEARVVMPPKKVNKSLATAIDLSTTNGPSRVVEKPSESRPTQATHPRLSSEVSVPSKTPVNAEPTRGKWTRSILEGMKVDPEATLNFFAYFQTEVEVSAEHFGAMLVVNEHMDYMLSELVEEVAGKPHLKSVEPGDFVLVSKAETEGSAFRGLVLATKGTLANVLLIDVGIAEKIELADIFPTSQAAHDIPALGLRFVLSVPVSTALQALVKTELDRDGGLFSGKISLVTHTPSGEVDRATVVLVDSSNGPLVTFEAHPFFKFDARARNYLGMASNRITPAILQTKPLPGSSQVVMNGYQETCDLAVIQLANDMLSEKSSKIDAILQDELGKFQVAHLVPIKGQLLACKWTKGDCYYRAEVVSVDPGRKKVKVRFIDYGNQAIEGFERLTELPLVLADPKYPALAHTVKLDGVPSRDIAEPIVAVGLKHVAPQLEVPFVLHYLKQSEDPPLVELIHPSKVTVNSMIVAKLKEGPTVEGDMQGKVVGGSFQYDKCHIMDLPMELDQELKVVVLHVESPGKVFVCAISQLGLYAKISDKIQEYCEKLTLSRSLVPCRGHVCLAQASDQVWYRAVSLGEVQSEAEDQSETEDVAMDYMMFFPDIGFSETVSCHKMTVILDIFMEVPFMANHCVLKDIHDADIPQENLGMVSREICKLIPDLSASVVVIKEKVDGAYFITLPQLKAEIESLLQKAQVVTESDEKKKRQIAELQAQLSQLMAQ